MFNIMWKLKLRYLEKKAKFYIWKGDSLKVHECLMEILGMLQAYIDYYLKPVFEEERS